MSAFARTANSSRTLRHVRKVPTAAGSFDEDNEEARQVSRGAIMFFQLECQAASFVTLVPHPRRCRMPRHLEALASIDDLAAVDFQDREILVHIIPGQDVLAIRGEQGPPPAIRRARHPGSWSPSCRRSSRPRGYRSSGSRRHSYCWSRAGLRRPRDHPSATDREPLGTVTDHHPVDDAGRAGFEIDDACGVDVAVRRACRCRFR